MGEGIGVTHQTVLRCLDRAVRLGVMAALDNTPRPGKAPQITDEVVGSPDALKAFLEMVPAPNDTYCNLFWPLDDAAASEALKKQHEANETQRQEQNLRISKREQASLFEA